MKTLHSLIGVFLLGLGLNGCSGRAYLGNYPLTNSLTSSEKAKEMNRWNNVEDSDERRLSDSLGFKYGWNNVRDSDDSLGFKYRF